MKKKGFTLVELLAVIAILAILVIIALPNVIDMYNQAKKSSFTTELKEIYKQAQQQWMNDSMLTTEEISYYRVGDTSASLHHADSTTGDGIKLTGRTQLKYYITLDSGGNVTEYFASDGSYQYAYVGSGVNVEQIDDGKTTVTDLTYSGTPTGLKNNTVYQVSALATGEKELTVDTTGAQF